MPSKAGGFSSIGDDGRRAADANLILVSDDNSLTGRVRRYAQVSTAMGGLAARLAGERYLGLNLDRGRHAAELYAANSQDCDGRMWTYLPWGPYDRFDDYLAAIKAGLLREDFITYAVIDAVGGKAVGVASYLNINAAAGSIEVGGIAYSPALQQKPAGTEAMYLMMRRALDELGYRRYAWQCNSLNARSRAAATRLGFTFEGVWRQANVHKGRNRDTAWFSILDSEWPAIKTAFESWLAPENFDAEGRQRMRLSVLTAATHRS